MRLSGLKVSYETLLSAAILDQLNVIRWALTNGKGKPPKPVLATLIDGGEPEAELFESGEDFLKERQRLLEKWQQ